MLKISAFYLDKQKSFIPKKHMKFVLKPSDAVLSCNSPSISKWHCVYNLIKKKLKGFHDREVVFKSTYVCCKPKKLKIGNVEWWNSNEHLFHFLHKLVDRSKYESTLVIPLED